MNKNKNAWFIVLHVFSWIIFVGLSIDAGAFISNTIYTIFINGDHAKYFWDGMNFSDLYQKKQPMFVVITIIMCIIAILKAIMFYLIVKIYYNKNYDLSRPFNNGVKRFIQILAFIALGIGLFSVIGVGYYENLVLEGINLPLLKKLKIAGGDIWLFMSVILFVIAQVFKKGIEIQEDNDLML